MRLLARDRELLGRSALGGSGGWACQLLIVFDVVYPADHHLIISRVAPADRLGRIRIGDVLLRVIEVGRNLDSRPTGYRHRFLVIVSGLPAKAVVRHVEKDLWV